MKRVTGRYFDGQLSVGQSAQMECDVLGVRLSVGEHTLELDRDEVRIQNQVGNTPRRVTWGSVASFVTEDAAALEAFADQLPGSVSDAWINRLERSWIIALGCLIVAVALLGAIAVVGVPQLARIVAGVVPTTVSAQLGETTLSKIDGVLEPSELPQETQDWLQEYLGRYEQVETIALRKSERLGPNAFTLSATTVVITDELVELLDEEELLAVFWHEVGHAQLKHVERNILQSSAWVVLLTLISGDATGAAELVLTLPVIVGQMAYSRDMEREADGFAVGALQQLDVSPLALASALEKLEDHHRHSDQPQESQGEDASGEDAGSGIDAGDQTEPDVQDDAAARRLLEYFSTHPATEERIAEIKRNASILSAFE